MSLPDWLKPLLPGDTATTWEAIAPLIPNQAYLAGGTAIATHLRHRTSRDLDFFYHDPALDLDQLVEKLQERGPFAITQRAPGTLNGLYAQTRIQLLQAGVERPERQLEPITPLAGLQIAGLGDLLAMKLNAITGRAQLRDYYDLMAIEQHGHRSVDEGLGLYLARYQPQHEDTALRTVLLALGHLDDVTNDPSLPLDRDTITAYWQHRQPQLLAALDRHGTTRPPPKPPHQRINPPSRNPEPPEHGR